MSEDPVSQLPAGLSSEHSADSLYENRRFTLSRCTRGYKTNYLRIQVPLRNRDHGAISDVVIRFVNTFAPANKALQSSLKSHGDCIGKKRALRGFTHLAKRLINLSEHRSQRPAVR
jgi:hypothetical protein